MSTEPNYRRTKPGMKASVPNSNGAAGPASQIPGLSQSADTAPVEKSKGRRVGIQATDSDYVKLAKQGGHKGLLSHDAEDTSTKSMTSQPSDSSSGDDQSQSKVSSQKLVAPFGTDDCSAWDNDSGAGKNKSPVGQATQEMQKLLLSPKEIEEANKYKDCRFFHDDVHKSGKFPTFLISKHKYTLPSETTFLWCKTYTSKNVK
ncbi:uncharacterized protein C7orf57 homolog isoform X1 [Pangasianodon hypophthalmus]|uniref:uncharacterized protein C7orf57 homolog isoform X1 n=1 Tax=Pangasianodon hypophthalmus TaxID=310915 RepID=UPI0023072A89|nr:uncharacterized protein C7orf57 homolog isoform X1 [Pangasianodon hypophthalmus]